MELCLDCTSLLVVVAAVGVVVAANSRLLAFLRLLFGGVFNGSTINKKLKLEQTLMEVAR